MRAIALESFETGPGLHELPVPAAGPEEVLVRVRNASLNGFDVMVASGMLKEMMEHRFPVVLGKDFAGTVESEVSGFRVGDDVFGTLMKPFVGDGTFAEYVTIPAAIGLTRIPSGLNPSIAGALGLVGTAAAASIDAISPSEGETVLISGATGGVGAVAIQLAVAHGAEVIATARPGEEADFVRGLGAAFTVDYTGDLAGELRAVRPHGVDAVIHLAGDGMQLADLVSSGGRFASTLGIGPDQLGDRKLDATAIMTAPTADVLDSLGAEVASGRVRVPIRRTYSLEDVPQAIADFAAGTMGKFGVTIDE